MCSTSILYLLISERPIVSLSQSGAYFVAFYDLTWNYFMIQHGRRAIRPIIM